MQDQRQHYDEFLSSIKDGFYQSIKKCFPVFAENGLTPIEEKFFFALIEKVLVPSIFREPTSFGKAGLFRVTDFKVFPGQRMLFVGKSKELYDAGFWKPFTYFFRSQFNVNLEGKKMRLDFTFFIYDSIDVEKMKGSPPKGRLSIAIELDGHDFHEKTKEQAQKDKERDRILQQGGYLVLRYTGSEVWNDPSGVVDDVMQRIFKFIASKIERPQKPFIGKGEWKPPEW